MVHKNVNPRFLLIKAKGGLGNRILSAITGLVYADLSQRQPVIDWRDGTYASPGVNAYPLLFEGGWEDVGGVAAIPDVTPKIWAGHLNAHPGEMIARYHPRHHGNPLIYRAYCVDLNRIFNPARVAVYWSYVPKLSRLKRYLKADDRFRDKSVEQIFSEYLTKYFTLKDTIIKKVNETMAAQKRPLIGVHVRYTDLKIPLSSIEKRISELLRQNPASSIYLATDNQHIQNSFSAKYERVYWTEKWMPPDGRFLHHNEENPDPITEAKNALVDMWCLSRCDKLVFSSSSTFSYTSSLLGKFTRQNLYDVEQSSPLVMVKRWLRDYA